MNPIININEYNYELPNELIAYEPANPRDSAKQLIYNKGKLIDDVFSNITNWLDVDTLLVFNNTRTIHARLHFITPTGAVVEVFVLEPATPTDMATFMQTTNTVTCVALIGNLKKFKIPTLSHTIGNTVLTVQLSTVTVAHITVTLSWNTNDTFAQIIETFGKVPLPPYIKRSAIESDKTTYQTIYAQTSGSIATPTAGLHFTPAVMQALLHKGIECTHTTLHVGAGTFMPVKTDDAAQHTMHAEELIISKALIENIYSTSKTIVAVGTTSCRLLESMYWLGVKCANGETPNYLSQWEYKTLQPISTQQALQALINYCTTHNLQELVAKTQIMITPGYQFKIVKALITNFHQPKSTLLLLISAFIGDDWKRMYSHAIANNYRFFSYGDSSLLRV
ncbi:MAG: S-adenosylmethionine:tRNA ribosyltransferase-isomerase [Bacteroidia bacterium]|nr:S-adenosylmethionine:tRNA ribosyltransferase-isomerase [Bacteroidia bacterium]